MRKSKTERRPLVAGCAAKVLNTFAERRANLLRRLLRGLERNDQIRVKPYGLD
jgi:hypothetical protein